MPRGDTESFIRLEKDLITFQVTSLEQKQSPQMHIIKTSSRALELRKRGAIIKPFLPFMLQRKTTLLKTLNTVFARGICSLHSTEHWQ